MNQEDTAAKPNASALKPNARPAEKKPTKIIAKKGYSKMNLDEYEHNYSVIDIGENHSDKSEPSETITNAMMPSPALEMPDKENEPVALFRGKRIRHRPDQVEEEGSGIITIDDENFSRRTSISPLTVPVDESGKVMLFDQDSMSSSGIIGSDSRPIIQSSAFKPKLNDSIQAFN